MALSLPLRVFADDDREDDNTGTGGADRDGPECIDSTRASIVSELTDRDEYIPAGPEPALGGVRGRDMRPFGDLGGARSSNDLESGDRCGDAANSKGDSLADGTSDDGRWCGRDGELAGGLNGGGRARRGLWDM